MREVLNTVGKRGKLGEHIRCVVSVSMLTEGWDCNTVTHILGVRAFGTRLLCEQVMGRGLRRRSYATDDKGMMAPEYADIYGVPFSGFPVAGLPEERTPPTPKPGKAIRAIPERLIDAPWLEVTFPVLSVIDSMCRPNCCRRSSMIHTVSSSQLKTFQHTRSVPPLWE